MKLFVANLSLQHHAFLYREPETNRQLQKDVRAGQQVQIGGEAAPEFLSAIVAQHEKYGLVPAQSLSRRTEFTGLCYQFAKPIKIATLLEGMMENKRRLEEQGPEMLKRAAAAAGVGVRQHLYEVGRRPVKDFRIEVEEVTPEGLRGADAESFNRTKLHQIIGVDLRE